MLKDYFGIIISVVIIVACLVLFGTINIKYLLLFLLVCIIVTLIILFALKKASISTIDDSYKYETIFPGMHSISWTENDSAHSKAALCLSLIPPRVNLIDREEDIQSIKELLSQNSIVCLLGEAGIGKTAIATHLANNEKDSIITKDSNYNHVAWVDGRKDIEIGFHHLDIPDSFSQSSEKDRYHSIIKWLQQNPTFIVIDDLDHTLDEKEAAFLNTICGKTKVLITTRVNLDNITKYYVKALSHKDSISLFELHYPLTPKLVKADNELDFINKIVEIAGYNPLLIEIASKTAYWENLSLSDVLSSFTGAVTDYRSNKSAVVDNQIRESIKSLYRIHSLTKEQKEIMLFMSLFPSEKRVFFDVFNWAGFHGDNLEFLTKCGWIIRDTEGYYLHRLTKESINLQSYDIEHTFFITEHDTLVRELANTSQYIPITAGYNVITERIIIPDIICSLFEKQEVPNPAVQNDILFLQTNLAKSYFDLGLYEKALSLYDKAISYSDINKSNSLLTATLFNSIAIVLNALGRYEEAILYCNDAYDIRIKRYGEYHPLTAEVYSSIAKIYNDLGDYRKAIELLIKVIVIREKYFGKEHLDTATAYDNIAEALSGQCNYKDALEYLDKAQSIREKKLGGDHPDTATTYNNIGVVYSNQGKYLDALKYFEKAKSIQEKLLGDKHPDTATTYNNIGVVYSNQGDASKAMEYYIKALSIRKTVLGGEHPFTATTYRNISVVYNNQGEHEKASELNEMALCLQNKKERILENINTEAKGVDINKIVLQDLNNDSQID